MKSAHPLKEVSKQTTGLFHCSSFYRPHRKFAPHILVAAAYFLIFAFQTSQTDAFSVTFRGHFSTSPFHLKHSEEEFIMRGSGQLKRFARDYAWRRIRFSQRPTQIFGTSFTSQYSLHHSVRNTRLLSALPTSYFSTPPSDETPTEIDEVALWRKTQAELLASEKDNEDKYTPYERLVRRLYMTNLFNPVKMGLKNIEELHKALGSPMDNPDISIIHVAGTNGKGSVSLKIAKSLELSGHRVGLFVSPHVASFRERMQVNSELMPESAVVSLLARVFDACEEHGIPATFFEITTALAFLHFAESKVDAVVLETGLGGRLDATNVIKSPSVSVITSIGLEHTRILGDTVELIAKEKGGIIKPGRPVLVGPNVPHAVLRQCAEEKGASGYYTCDDVLGTYKIVEESGVEKSSKKAKILHDYDKENAHIAKAALAILMKQQTEEQNEENRKTDDTNSLVFQRRHLGPITAEQIEQGTSLRPPCRFEEITVKNPKGSEQSVDVVLDVAHNPSAMEYLVSKLESTYPDKTKRFVVGFSSDKDLAKCGQLLLSSVPDASNLHVVEALHPRAAKLESILGAEPRLRKSNFDKDDRSVTAQVKYALELAAEKDELLVVCGSVFLMDDAREALGYDEPRDSDCISEMSGSNLKHGQENFGTSDTEKAVMKAASEVINAASNKC